MFNPNSLNEPIHLYLVCTPGLEELVLRELRLKSIELESCQQVKGGIEVSALPSKLLQLNNLKTITRVLLRLSEAKVRDFPKLYNKIIKINWNPIIGDRTPKIRVTSHTSRLIHTDKISKAVLDGIEEYRRRNPVSKKYQNRQWSTDPEVFIRLEDDQLQVSFNTSGRSLYFRGNERQAGVAPIRENIAAALGLALTDGLTNSYTLIDPMCGSGTLLREHANFFESEERPFAFENTVLEKTKQDNVLSSQKEVGYIGFDHDEIIIEKAKLNSPGRIRFERKDCFHLEKKDFAHPQIICNPPYNRRIKTNQSCFYKELYEALEKQYGPERVLLVLPKGVRDQINIEPVSTWTFRNGGFKVEACLYHLK